MAALQSASLARSFSLPQLDVARWYAAYVVTRHEKAVAERLFYRTIETFLPLYRTIHHWNKRKAHVELPLFPSYVFVRIPAREYLRVLQVPGVVHIVSFENIPAPLPDEEVEALRTAIRLRRCEPWPYPIVGRRVHINEGPLRGLQGVVTRQLNQNRIIVSVDFIRQSTSVELAPEDLQFLPDATPPLPSQILTSRGF